MRTSKPISTICYLSPCDCRIACETLLSDGKISFYAFVEHIGEGTDKDHIHLFLMPCCEVDTSTPSFLIPFQGHVMPFNKSIFNDWFLYSSHDLDYLESKGEKKEEVNISPDSFFTSDGTVFHDMIDQIDRFRYMSPMARLLACYRDGLSCREAASKLRIPFGSLCGFFKVWNFIKNEDNTAFDKENFSRKEDL